MGLRLPPFVVILFIYHLFYLSFIYFSFIYLYALSLTCEKKSRWMWERGLAHRRGISAYFVTLVSRSSLTASESFISAPSFSPLSSSPPSPSPKAIALTGSSCARTKVAALLAKYHATRISRIPVPMRISFSSSYALCQRALCG